MPFKRFQKLEKVQLRSISVSEIFVSFDKCWKTKDEITIHTLCIKFLLSPKSQVSKIVVLENPAWALASGHVLSLKEMRLTLAFSSCCCCFFKHCLKIGSAGMYYFYATRPVYYTYQLLLYMLWGYSTFMCTTCLYYTTWTSSGQGAPTCRISLIAAILTNFKQVLALPSKCVGNKNWSTESSPIYIYTLYSQHRLIARLLNILLV